MRIFMFLCTVYVDLCVHVHMYVSLYVCVGDACVSCLYVYIFVCIFRALTGKGPGGGVL